MSCAEIAGYIAYVTAVFFAALYGVFTGWWGPIESERAWRKRLTRTDQ